MRTVLQLCSHFLASGLNLLNPLLKVQFVKKHKRCCLRADGPLISCTLGFYFFASKFCSGRSPPGPLQVDKMSLPEV